MMGGTVGRLPGFIPPSHSCHSHPQTTPSTNQPTPTQGLDEYVIGQDAVKKALAVGVANHYKRLAVCRRHRPAPPQAAQAGEGSGLGLDMAGGDIDPSLLATPGAHIPPPPELSPRGAPPPPHHNQHQQALHYYQSQQPQPQPQHPGGSSSHGPPHAHPQHHHAHNAHQPPHYQGRHGGQQHQHQQQASPFAAPLRRRGPRSAEGEGNVKNLEAVELDKTNLLLIGPTGSGPLIIMLAAAAVGRADGAFRVVSRQGSLQ